MSEFFAMIVRVLLFAAVCAGLYCLGVWLAACNRMALGERIRDAPLNVLLRIASCVRFSTR